MIEMLQPLLALPGTVNVIIGLVGLGLLYWLGGKLHWLVKGRRDEQKFEHLQQKDTANEIAKDMRESAPDSYHVDRMLADAARDRRNSDRGDL